MATPDPQKVSPGGAMKWGLGAFTSGALVAGAVSLFRATSALEKEGIDPKARTRALPLALRALGISSCVIGMLGVGGWFVLSNIYGMQLKNEARVASVEQALQEFKKIQVARPDHIPKAGDKTETHT